MSRKEFGKPVKRAALRRANGFCEGILDDGCRCTLPLAQGRFAFDHVNPDGLTGEPTLENCQVLCRACHDQKTKRDVADIARAKRREDAAWGIRKPSRLQNPGFPKAPPQRTASRPLAKTSVRRITCDHP